MPEYRVLTAGDTALVIEFGDRVDRELSTFVLALARRLAELRVEGIVETVPTFRSLMVHYDPQLVSASVLVDSIAQAMNNLRVTEIGGRRWQLPVCYDKEFGPDLPEVAARAELPMDEVVERHSAVRYHVYMLGFLPGFAYLGDLPTELVLARRGTPRPPVAAGSVAIATTMSCIFPRQSATGWYVIGRSPVPMWRSQSGSAALGTALLAPGDQVNFVPVSLREYADLAARANAGLLDIVPLDAATEAAA